MKRCSLFVFVILLVGFSGCVTTNVNLAQPETPYESTNKVQLLHEEPTRPYKVIATIKGNGSRYRKQSLVLDKILQKAKEMGAQAIIPVNSKVSYSSKPTFNEKPPKSVGSLGSRILGNAAGTKFKLHVQAIRFIGSTENAN